MQRRTFLQLAAASLAAPKLLGCEPAPGGRAATRKILVLGGTNFLGPAVVERAVERGHEVTLFNRGLTRPELFPELEKLRGERSRGGGDLAALGGGRRWDAVIDVWPEESELVAETARLLAGRAGFYFFVSSIAVYRDFGKIGLTEEDEVHRNDPGWYGGEKVLAEESARDAFPGRAGVARCHAILGPRDDGSAFHYWLRRLATEERVLAPGTGEDPVQLVDVRDVAAWIVDCVEQERAGTYNLAGPASPLPFRSFLEGCRDAIGSQAELVWVDADFLRHEQGVTSFDQMPLWAPLDEDAGFQQISSARALAEGMTFRPLAETARAAWHWYRAYFFRGTRFPTGGMGLARERELEVLAAWSERA